MAESEAKKSKARNQEQIFNSEGNWPMEQPTNAFNQDQMFFKTFHTQV